MISEKKQEKKPESMNQPHKAKEFGMPAVDDEHTANFAEVLMIFILNDRV